jgi:hypothetical protein
MYDIKENLVDDLIQEKRRHETGCWKQQSGNLFSMVLNSYDNFKFNTGFYISDHRFIYIRIVILTRFFFLLCLTSETSAYFVFTSIFLKK